LPHRLPFRLRHWNAAIALATEWIVKPLLVIVALIATVSRAGLAQAPAPASEPTRLEIGRFKSRALLQCASNVPAGAPLAIVVPGSGAHGPEEMMPAAATLDGTNAAILSAIAGGLRAGGFHTLQVGKPGVEFFAGSWEREKLAYDAELFLRLTWGDLIENVTEAVRYAEGARPCGASAIVLVGHSEGTTVVADAAVGNPAVRGLVFLGLQGESVSSAIEWQAYVRPVELFIGPDVDADHDGYITRDEAARWPKDFSYPWKDEETKVSIDAWSAHSRSQPQISQAIASVKASPLYGNGQWDRAPLYAQIAALPIPVLGLTGSLDVQTPPRQLQALSSACQAAKKLDCEVHEVPGVGHFFSAPRPPRAQVLVDATLGPVAPEFLKFFARTLQSWRSGVREK